MVAPALDLAYLTAAEAAALFRARELSPVDLTIAHLERIAALNGTLRAYLTVTEEIALAEAAILCGDDRPLLGVPVGYKDIYMTAGVRTTAGSLLHEHDVPAISATTVTKLHEAGMVMLGKLGTAEFAAGLTPLDYPLPPPASPWNTEHVPGGSSSGFSGGGLPLSMLISGRPFGEATVLRVGHAYERATDWHTRHPSL